MSDQKSMDEEVTEWGPEMISSRILLYYWTKKTELLWSAQGLLTEQPEDDQWRRQEVTSNRDNAMLIALEKIIGSLEEFRMVCSSHGLWKKNKEWASSALYLLVIGVQEMKSRSTLEPSGSNAEPTNGSQAQELEYRHKVTP